MKYDVMKLDAVLVLTALLLNKCVLGCASPGRGEVDLHALIRYYGRAG